MLASIRTLMKTSSLPRAAWAWCGVDPFRARALRRRSRAGRSAAARVFDDEAEAPKQ